MRWVLLVAAAFTACSGAAEPELAIMGQTPAQLPEWVSNSEDMLVRDLTQRADADHLSVFASRDREGNWCVVLTIERLQRA